jgi:hypothetical protein
VSLDTLWKIAVAIFGAGALFAGIRQLRKDLNGVGARQRAEAERAHYRFMTILVVLLTYTDNKEDRIQIGKRFLEDGGR